MKARLIAVLASVAVVAASMPSLVSAQPRVRPRVDIKRPNIRIQDPNIRIKNPNLRLQGRGPEVKFEANLTGDVLERAQNLNVYRLAPSKLGRESLSQLQNDIFGRGLGQVVNAGQLMGMSDPDNPANFLMLDARSGYMSFDRGLADEIDDNRAELPGDREAEDIARELFTGLEIGPENDKELVLGHISRIRSQSFDPATGQEGDIITQALVVHLARELDGVRVIGPGSKLIARIGDGGKIVGGSSRWRDVADTQSMRRQKQLNAQDIQNGIAKFLKREVGQAKGVQITGMGLFYYDGGNVIQPVVGYEASVQRAGGVRETYFGQFAILANPQEQVMVGPLSGKLREMLDGPPKGLQTDETGQD
ncbi:MAG TPA: hypothetical protein QGH10_18260 [Armatimonadota bacterium]|nr:hypothetical protein [Armatimonadota bacterium]